MFDEETRRETSVWSVELPDVLTEKSRFREIEILPLVRCSSVFLSPPDNVSVEGLTQI